ncbi:myocardin related transcription factor Ab isoform X1 [Anguilla anguilla]|uniref:myocardin related transcription factor Ab isoform X1 n=1 Tax=Anguilla anguilla TaxID=7936 RepID=UPI0015B2E5FA|nr:myocardin related transcription factor Ab isoform X1 [Anguilla anguilla]
MLDINPYLCFDSTLLEPLPIRDSLEKRGQGLDRQRRAYHSLKEVLQLRLQQRRTREELASQGIMPPLKSPAAFHEQRRSLERARTEDYLKRKIKSRPERSELVRMHILEETSAEPSLQAKQLKLKRARLADNLNDKISHRPGPIELIQKNILPVLHCSLKHSIAEGAGESSSLDEDSSDALSPDQPANHCSPLGHASLPSPPDVLAHSSNPSPTQFLSQSPLLSASEPSLPHRLTNGTTARTGSRPSAGVTKSRCSSDRTSQRSKRPKDSKPKVRKLKYHQYIPPDQKAEREPPPQMDDSYAQILHQQQLFLQLQIINQQQQHYNYHTILPAPPKPSGDLQSSTNTSPSQSRNAPTPSTASSNQSGLSRQSQAPVGGAKPGTLPPNLDELKVAELKQELKLRSLHVSGTKNDLIERLRNYQEQSGGAAAAGGMSGSSTPKKSLPQQQHQHTQPAGSSPSHGNAPFFHQSGERGLSLASSPAMVTAGTPNPIMHFGSTSSSPPLSPTYSERSCPGMSLDESSCNGDVFGETVSSPLTQPRLHPSPQRESACLLSQHASAPAAGSLDKDQMLQEKDKQIEELTRMLLQKQRLVETLRSQLEQGKRGGAHAPVKDEPPGDAGGAAVKEEAEPRVEEARQEAQPMQTVLQLQQRPGDQSQRQLQLRQRPGNQSQRQTQVQQRPGDQSQRQLQQRLGDQSRQKLQLQLQQRPGDQSQQQLQLQQRSSDQSERQLQLQQMPSDQSERQHQQRSDDQSEKQRQQRPGDQSERQLQQRPGDQSEQQLKQRPGDQSERKLQQLLLQQGQQKQKRPSQSEQVSPVFHSSQSGSPDPSPSFSLDLLKMHPAPTLVTDSNGNHYLIAVTSRDAEGQRNGSSQGKATSRITLQSLHSSPSKIPAQSASQPASMDSQSKQPRQPGLVTQPIRKGQKPGLHVVICSSQEAGLSLSAPANQQAFFLSDESAPSGGHTPSSPTHKLIGEGSSGLDQHTLFKPPSPAPKQTSSSSQRKGNGSCSQHMDDLFDILTQSGELSSGLKADPDPSLSNVHPGSAPLPSPTPSTLLPSPPSPPESVTSRGPTEKTAGASVPGDGGGTGNGRLEDFLESTTGAPLIGVEPGGPLTLIDDLHNQMLSTSSILDHPPTPMDTCELSFTPQHPGLDFGDGALDSMDWLDITMNGTGGVGPAPPSSHMPPSVFSVDFLDSPDLQLHWESCL